MQSRINKMIEAVETRTVAKPKSAAKEFSLREKVLALVDGVNYELHEERRVTPRAALTVMDRAFEEFSILEDDARDFAVMREVSRFISTTKNTYTVTASASKHVDLLPQGHPLSALNASLSPDEFRVKYAHWLAADSGISDDARPLVASAHSATPGSVERDHAFLRLRVTKHAVPNVLKFDELSSLTAAFSAGNSSAARRARVALQWRDRKGRWVEMGRGINFKVAMPDGSIQSLSGIYVGGDSRGTIKGNWAQGESTSKGLIQVTNQPGVPDGIYAISNGNAESYQARLTPEQLKRGGVSKSKAKAAGKDFNSPDLYNENIPTLEELQMSIVDAPDGWTKNEDGSFSSDDDYKAFTEDGEYTLFRMNDDGSLGDKVGDASNWAEIQKLASADEEEFDKVKAEILSGELPLGDQPPAAQPLTYEQRQAQARLDDLRKRGQDRQAWNDAYEQVIKQAAANEDVLGRKLPEGWNVNVETRGMLPGVTYRREIPGATRSDEYIVGNVDKETGNIRIGSGGEWLDGEAANWNEVAQRAPQVLDQINQGRASIRLEPLNDPQLAADAKSAGEQEPPTTPEPPTPPSGPSGGTPIKPVSPSNPDAPALFENFEAPSNAFQLRTAEYTPEGRVDETSTDFTDDPKRLATKFTQQDLVSAMSEALLGNTSDAAINDILSANVNDNEDLADAAEAVETSIAQTNVGQPSGAGQLEFNAGPEFVPAESLFNALWEAGLDPNRVIASIYDSANGDNTNVTRLIEAQGGVPSQDEAQLVDDIMQEIRQIKDAAPDETPVANQKETPSEDKLPGSLTENMPIDFDNPDYYQPDLEAYVPSQENVDENGFTDNPQILAQDFYEADLIDQLIAGITDGSGAGLLAFDEATYEIPVEALRDALQYAGVNTNDLLIKLRDESNDMSEEPSTPETPETPEEPVVEEPVVETPVEPTPEVTPEEVPAAPSLVYPGPENRGYHPDNTVLDITGKVIGNGSRIRASRDGRMGTVIAVQNIDSRTGERIPYVRVRFDDGSVAVRSATKVRSTDEMAQQVAQGPVVRQQPMPNVAERLNAPNAPAGAVAGEGNIPGVNSLGALPEELAGTSNLDAKQSDFAAWGDRAAEIARAGRERATLANIKQAAIDMQKADLAYRAARVSGDDDAKREADAAYTAAKSRVSKLLTDTYGVREEVTFGEKKYYLSAGNDPSISISGSSDELDAGTNPMTITVNLKLRNANGEAVGTVTRVLNGKPELDTNGDMTRYKWYAKNQYLEVVGSEKKSGFASAFNRYMEDWYIANGVDEIHVHAAGGGGYQGALVWALNGFNWETPRDAGNEVFNRLTRMERTASAEEKKAIQQIRDYAKSVRNTDGSIDLDKTPTPLELALVGWYPGAKNWVGKKFMVANTWMGVKRLNPGAKEQLQAANYDQVRNARGRIERKENKANLSREAVLKMNSNEFENLNVELQPYMEEIRDVFKNNRPMAVLSPAAKNALRRYSAAQLTKTDNRDMSLDDIFKLRTLLLTEDKADNPRKVQLTSEIGSGEYLTQFEFSSFENNQIPGFTTKRLGPENSGYNETYLVTHNDSGQQFYVKNEQLAENYQINGAATEMEAGIIMRGLGFDGVYQTKQSAVDPNIIIMQKAGTSIPLSGEPMTAYKVLDHLGGLHKADGTAVDVNMANVTDKLVNPEDAARLILIDLLMNNQDRHNGNVLLALDGTDPSRVRVLPIDHSLATLDSDRYETDELLTSGEIYKVFMRVLSRRMKQDELLSMFRNEGNRLRAMLADPASAPTGNELGIITNKWGSYQAFVDKVNERLDAILNRGGGNHSEFLQTLKPNYWTY